jgi:hypothetical protein
MISAKTRQPFYYHSFALDARAYFRDTAILLIFGRGIHDDFQITEHLAGS